MAAEAGGGWETPFKPVARSRIEQLPVAVGMLSALTPSRLPATSLQVVGIELYDHSQTSQLDNSYLDATENVNLATDPASGKLLLELKAQLKSEVEKWLA